MSQLDPETLNRSKFLESSTHLFFIPSESVINPETQLPILLENVAYDVEYVKCKSRIFGFDNVNGTVCTLDYAAAIASTFIFY